MIKTDKRIKEWPVSYCLNCGIENPRFSISPRKYCSKSCLFQYAWKDPEKRLRRTLAKMAEGNPMWAGKHAGLQAIHIWVRERKPNGGFCQICFKKKRLDLANISQEYKRDLSDWEWLCRKCHMTKDGRGDKLRTRERDAIGRLV